MEFNLYDFGVSLLVLVVFVKILYWLDIRKDC